MMAVALQLPPSAPARNDGTGRHGDNIGWGHAFSCILVACASWGLLLRGARSIKRSPRVPITINDDLVWAKQLTEPDLTTSTAPALPCRRPCAIRCCRAGCILPRRYEISSLRGPADQVLTRIEVGRDTCESRLDDVGGFDSGCTNQNAPFWYFDRVYRGGQSLQ